MASNGTCLCQSNGHTLIDGVCFPNSDLKDSTSLDTKNAFKLDYERHRLESRIFKENLRSAHILCKEKEDNGNQTACQVLANLCTLNLHSVETSEPGARVCDLFWKLRGANSNSQHIRHIPKLYYAEYEAPSLLTRHTEIPHQYNMDFSSHSSDINITTAKFSFDGKFLGLSDLNEHIPCSDPPLVQGISRKFGATYKTHCSMGIQELWEKYKKEEMYFLEPHVSYQAGYHAQRHLYNLPVKILNFKKNGLKANLVRVSIIKFITSRRKANNEF